MVCSGLFADGVPLSQTRPFRKDGPPIPVTPRLNLYSDPLSFRPLGFLLENPESGFGGILFCAVWFPVGIIPPAHHHPVLSPARANSKVPQVCPHLRGLLPPSSPSSFSAVGLHPSNRLSEVAWTEKYPPPYSSSWTFIIVLSGPFFSRANLR